MRESIGGALLLKLVTIFLIVYIFFMAIIINFAHAYRIKNSLLSYIEEREGIADIDSFAEESARLGYGNGRKLDICKMQSIKGIYYKLTIYAQFELPIIGTTIDIPVKGSTKIIEVTELSNEQLDIVPDCV